MGGHDGEWKGFASQAQQGLWRGGESGPTTHARWRRCQPTASVDRECDAV
jgi:hypothetical protein